MLGRTHVGPHQITELTRRIGGEADPTAHRVVTREGRYLHAVAARVELPAVVDAADAALLVAAEEEVGASMGADGLDETDAVVAVAKRNELFTENRDAHRRPVTFRDLAREEHRDPEPAEQLSHGRLGPGPREQLVVFRAEHPRLL